MTETKRRAVAEKERAYSLFEVKAVDDERRVITGVATTPTPDRMEDIVVSEGAEYTLPIPFLWQHDSRQPIGHVTKAKVTSKGIEVEVQVEKTDEPGPVKDRLDGAWQDIKLRLVRGLSIGFKPMETAEIQGSWGVKFIRWLWLELSAVTIAANGDCSIQNIKSIDAELLAASGRQSGSDATKIADPPPAATGKEVRVVKLSTPARDRAPMVIRKINRL